MCSSHSAPYRIASRRVVFLFTSSRLAGIAAAIALKEDLGFEGFTVRKDDINDADTRAQFGVRLYALNSTPRLHLRRFSLSLLLDIRKGAERCRWRVEGKSHPLREFEREKSLCIVFPIHL